MDSSPLNPGTKLNGHLVLTLLELSAACGFVVFLGGQQHGVYASMSLELPALLQALLGWRWYSLVLVPLALATVMPLARKSRRLALAVSYGWVAVAMAWLLAMVLYMIQLMPQAPQN